MFPSILMLRTSVNGVLTDPICSQKRSSAVPDGITTLCPNVAVSADVAPPNHAHVRPLRGCAVPPPVPQAATVQRGVPKLVEVCGLFQVVLGIPPLSKPPSTMTLAGVHDGEAEGCAVAVFVAVAVAVEVDVAVDVGVLVLVLVGVFVGVLVFVAVGVLLVGAAVGVFVEVAVFVAVFVGVFVGVFVLVAVGVLLVGAAVGVFVAVFVFVGVAWPFTSTEPLSQPAPKGRTWPR